MWPLHFVLLLAFAAQPQQAPSFEVKPDASKGGQNAFGRFGLEHAAASAGAIHFHDGVARAGGGEQKHFAGRGATGDPAGGSAAGKER